MHADCAAAVSAAPDFDRYLADYLIVFQVAPEMIRDLRPEIKGEDKPEPALSGAALDQPVQRRNQAPG